MTCRIEQNLHASSLAALSYSYTSLARQSTFGNCSPNQLMNMWRSDITIVNFMYMSSDDVGRKHNESCRAIAYGRV